jgi:hypothetical protein
LLRGFWLKSKTGKNKDEFSIAVAVDSLFAPGFSNQKPFTEKLMQPLQKSVEGSVLQKSKNR